MSPPWTGGSADTSGTDGSLTGVGEGAVFPGPRLEVQLLGGLQIRCDGVPLSLGGQRRSCVLAVLLINHGRTVSLPIWPSGPGRP